VVPLISRVPHVTTAESKPKRVNEKLIVRANGRYKTNAFWLKAVIGKKVGAVFLWKETQTRELAFASMDLLLFIFEYYLLFYKEKNHIISSTYYNIYIYFIYSHKKGEKIRISNLCLMRRGLQKIKRSFEDQIIIVLFIVNVFLNDKNIIYKIIKKK
jgi:hypothetical protein